MARLSLALLIILFVLIYQAPSMQSRKLFNAEKKAALISLKDNNLVPTAVPKKPPTDKDHIMANNERLFAVHLAKIDRILQSIPSPGAGH